MAETTRLETLLRHDKWIVCAGLVTITILAWVYLLSGAGMAMSMSDMTILSFIPYQHAGMSVNMPQMGMLAGDWSPGHWAIVFMMWWVMMIAMMVPGAAPMILLYARVIRYAQKNDRLTRITGLTSFFVIGYLVSWLVFSVFATSLHWGMEQNDWLSMKMITNKGWLSGGLLIAVGIYQLTPLKAACLRHCRSPAEFIASHMKNGNPGALLMGFEHGIFCVGCCWLLMVLLFVGGVMNLLWIVFLTFVVLAEKILPHGELVTKFTGFVLIAWGAFILTTLLR